MVVSWKANKCIPKVVILGGAWWCKEMFSVLLNAIFSRTHAYIHMYVQHLFRVHVYRRYVATLYIQLTLHRYTCTRMYRITDMYAAAYIRMYIYIHMYYTCTNTILPSIKWLLSSRRKQPVSSAWWECNILRCANWLPKQSNLDTTTSSSPITNRSILCEIFDIIIHHI